MNGAVVKDFGLIRYIDENKKDEFGVKVFSRYVSVDDKWVVDGYMYRRGKLKINQLKKEYGKTVGVREFVDCYLKVN